MRVYTDAPRLLINIYNLQNNCMVKLVIFLRPIMVATCILWQLYIAAFTKEAFLILHLAKISVR